MDNFDRIAYNGSHILFLTFRAEACEYIYIYIKNEAVNLKLFKKLQLITYLSELFYDIHISLGISVNAVTNGRKAFF